MRTLLIIAILGISTNFAFSECTDYMQAFNKHQLVMKGLLDLTLEGKIDKPTVDAIAVRQKEAIKYQDAGEYQKACEMYDSILDDYGFDKSFGEAPTPDKEESSNSSSSNEASTASDSAATSSSSEASSSADSAETQPTKE